MSRLSDPKYLMSEQYKNASNIDARQQLHDRFSTNKYGWHPWVFDQFKLSAESRVLELGCGAANLWCRNAHRISDGCDITLTDLSPGMLQDAQRNLQDSQKHFKFVAVDAQSLPFADKNFDAIIANHMLYHVPDRDRAFSEIHRVLKPGGCLYAATIGESHLQELGELVRSFDPGIAFKPWDNPFSLENGLAQISQWFPKVSLRRYGDSLVITEVEPLVAYVLSSMTNASLTLVGDRLVEFVNFVKQKLTLHGVIKITKDSGIFIALM